MALIDKLTAIADAIRGKTGKTEEMTLDQMVTEIEGIQSGGGVDTAVEDGFLTGILAEKNIVNSRIENIKKYAFYETDIETAGFPNVTTIGSHIFYNCKNLKSISLPKVEKGSQHLFTNCSSLETIYIPQLYYVDANMIVNCTSLTSLVFEQMVEVYTSALSGCTSLKTIEFKGGAKLMRNTIFDKCASLDTLIIRGDSVATLSYATAFSNTPFASGGTGGKVYVPQALISAYQTATNWSTLYAAGSCNFVAIEGSEYE